MPGSGAAPATGAKVIAELQGDAEEESEDLLNEREIFREQERLRSVTLSNCVRRFLKVKIRENITYVIHTYV